MKKKSLWVLVVILVMSAAGYGGWSYYKGRQKPAVGSFTAEPVRRGDVTLTVTDTGTVTGMGQVDVRPEVTGNVVDVRFNVGDSVKQGDVLAVMQNKDLADQVAQTRLDLAAAQAKLQEMKSPSSRAAQSDLDLARMKVRQAEASLAARKQDLANLVIASPISGVISSVAVGEGGPANAGTLVATVIDTSDLYFKLPVSEDLVRYVRAGQPADVVIGDDNAGRHGSVSYVGREGYQSNGKTVFDVTIKLDPDPDPLKWVGPGMRGYAIINTRPADIFTVEGKGFVQAKNRVDVRAQVSGTVDEVPVQEGTTVKAGQVIARLSNDGLAQQARQAEIDLTSTQNNLANLLQPPGTASDADIQAQQIKIDQLKLTLASRERDLAALTISAPVGGTIIARNINMGDRPGTNQVIATIADYSSMQVVAGIDELDVGKIKVGLPAKITVEALRGKAYDATVTKIAPSGTTSQGVTTYPVTLTIPNAKGILAGMTANVSILADQRQGVLYVPVEAVQRKGDQQLVRLVKNDEVTQVEVKTGLSTDTVVEVVSGLNERDQVVISMANMAQPNGFRGFGMFGGQGGPPPRPTGGSGPSSGGSRPSGGGGKSRSGGR